MEQVKNLMSKMMNSTTTNLVSKCKECGREIKPIEIELLGQKKYVKGMCECAKEKIRKEQEKIEKRERLNRINELYKYSQIPLRYMESTFKSFTNRNGSNAVLNACMDYVSGYKEHNKKGRGLLIHGNVGNGKTHLVNAIAHELIPKGVGVFYANVPELFLELQRSFKEGNTSQIISRLMYSELLILDDIGSEKFSEYTETTLYSIINHRYKNYKPILATTNLNLKELKEKIGSRSFDRLLETTRLVENKATSYRRELALKRRGD